MAGAFGLVAVASPLPANEYIPYHPTGCRYVRKSPEGKCCDPGDRHVLAAAIAAKAEVIVTLNVRHFPAEVLVPLGSEAVTPDQFLCNLLDLAPGAIHGCLQTIAARQRNPARTAQDHTISAQRSTLIPSRVGVPQLRAAGM